MKKQSNIILLILAIPILSFFFAMNKNINKPVMEYIIRVDNWQIVDEGVIRGYFIGKKSRNCARVPDSEIAYAGNSSAENEISMEYVDDKTPDSSFPEGIINIGWIQFDGDIIDSERRVGWSMLHDCDGIHIPSTYWFETL